MSAAMRRRKSTGGRTTWGASVVPGAAQAVGHLARCGELEAVVGEGGACAIAQEPLEAAAVARLGGDVGVEGEPIDQGAAGAGLGRPCRRRGRHQGLRRQEQGLREDLVVVAVEVVAATGP